MIFCYVDSHCVICCFFTTLHFVSRRSSVILMAWRLTKMVFIWVMFYRPIAVIERVFLGVQHKVLPVSQIRGNSVFTSSHISQTLSLIDVSGEWKWCQWFHLRNLTFYQLLSSCPTTVLTSLCLINVHSNTSSTLIHGHISRVRFT